MSAKDKMCGIYCIENLKNHKKYIGQSVDIKKRWRNHRYKLNGNKHPNQHLQNSWNYYGKDNFKFYVLELCDIDCLDDKETYYINLFSSNDNNFGYNDTSGGQTNKTLSDEAKRKISDAHKGKVLSDEHKKKLSEINLGRYTGVDHHGHKPVYCPELNEYFWGATEVQQKYGISRSTVTQCCKQHGFYKSAGKHPETGEKLHWFYVDSLRTEQNY